MKHHGMLLFLSDVKATSEGKISTTTYTGIGECHTTNESAVRYMLQHLEPSGTSLEKLFALVTKKVRDEEITCGRSKQLFYDDGKTWTHVAYFKRRMEQFIPHIEAVMEEAPYHEEATIQENMQSIVTMARKIEAYIDTLPDEDTLVLHADCTGGMRHAAMIMMALLRLLQYNRRIQIGDILYSNFNKHIVEKANDIYGLFDLIAGAEEFVRFGSVNTMKEYYQSQEEHTESAALKPSAHLQELTNAMEEFADAIKVCNAGVFEQAVRDLKEGMNHFEEYMERGDTTGLSDDFMGRLYGRIKAEYKLLLEDYDEVRLIQWCVEKDYIQQALTLYTEAIPEFFGKHQLAALTEQGKEAFNAQFEANDPRTDSFKLYTLLEDKADDSQRRLSNQINCYAGEIRKAIKGLQKKCKNDKETDFASEEAHSLLEAVASWGFTVAEPEYTYSSTEEMLSLVQQLCRFPGKTITENQDDKLLQKVISLYIEANGEALFVGKPPYDQGNKLQKWLPQLKQKALLAFFPTLTIPKSRRFIRLLENEWVQSDISKEDWLMLMNDYYEIRNIRNQTNHAKDEERTVTTKDISEKILQGLATIRRVVGQ